MNTLKRDDWQLIVKRIHKGYYVPFLGAGANVSSAYHNYVGHLLGGDVALRIVEEWLGLKQSKLKDVTRVTTHKKIMNSKPLYDDLIRVTLENLPRVALHVEFRQDFSFLFDYLKLILPDDRKPSPLLETLANLPPPKSATHPPFQLIVTTNYDDLMEKALAANKRDFKVVVQRPEGFESAEQKKLEQELSQYTGVVVYKIHGSFGEGENKDAHSIIITEEDYIRFLTVINKEVQGIPPLIKAKLVQLDSVVFGL